MFKSFSEAQSFIEKNTVQMIDLKFCDLWGRWHHVTLSASAFEPGLMEAGVGFDGSSVGLKSVKSGDMALIPDLSTGVMDPYWEVPTLSFICYIVEAVSKKRFFRDPREIARRAEDALVSSGIADRSIWGPEFEFYVFNKVSFENSNNCASYHLDALEAEWNSSSQGLGNFIAPHGGYHAIPPRDQLFNLRTKIVMTLQKVGVPVKYHHHEVGGPGQCEIETPLMGLIAAADAAMMIKYVTHMNASLAGQAVTFLPKPLYGEAGSGMHFHQQLFKGDVNTFYDADSSDKLSKVALAYIAGLLLHAPSLLAFTNPTTNSYRRLVPGFEAPVNCFYSLGNRSAAIRVPAYATEPRKVRMEFRPPDGTCNPYLAMASMLLAGLDGIKQNLDPTSMGFGPINENIFAWPEEKRATIKSLPTSLGQALDALEQDHDYLLSDGVFDEEIVSDWIAAKRKEESQLSVRPHPFEIQNYFDF
jgi:glutamine synthetase